MEVYIPSVKNGFPLGSRTMVVIFFFPFSFFLIFPKYSIKILCQCPKWEKIKLDKIPNKPILLLTLCPEFWLIDTAAITDTTGELIFISTSGNLKDKTRFQADVFWA